MRWVKVAVVVGYITILFILKHVEYEIKFE